jgi:HlyD family secretion protein
VNNPVVLRRTLGASVLAALLAWGLYSGFRPQAIDVELGAATRGPLRVTIDQEGRTRVVDRYVVTAPVSGYARRIRLEVGDRVERGASAVQLEALRAEALDPRRRAEAEQRVGAAEDNASAVAQREKAALAAAELAHASLKRVRDLRAQGHATTDAEDRARTDAERADSELRSAKFAVDAARHELEAARSALRFAAAGSRDGLVEVRAPVAGQVLRIPRKSEGPVAAGQALIEIGAAEALEVEVDVLSADAVRLRPGTRVLFERWGGPTPLEGVVRVVEPTGFTKVSALGVEEQRVWVIVRFSSPREQWQRLGDAYRVEASFVVWEEKDVLQVPAGSIFRDGKGWAAFAVQDGKAVKRPLEIGQRGGLAAQVLSGIAEGERVVVHPDDRLRDGVRVVAR